MQSNLSWAHSQKLVLHGHGGLFLVHIRPFYVHFALFAWPSYRPQVHDHASWGVRLRQDYFIAPAFIFNCKDKAICFVSSKQFYSLYSGQVISS